MTRIPDAELKRRLVADGVASAEAFDEAAESASRLRESAADILISRGVLSEEYYTNVLSEYFGVPRANLKGRVIDEEALRMLPESVALSRRAVIFGKDERGALLVAMEDPSDAGTLSYLEGRFHAKVKPHLATRADLNHAYAFYSKQITEDFKKIIEENVALTLRTKREGASAEQAAGELPIVAIVDNLLSYASAAGASDVHLEVLEDALLVRFRIDGILHEMVRMPKEAHPAILARIKLLAALKLDEHNRPQDGRLRFKRGGDFIDIRVSVMPTFYGEKAELRVLSSAARPLSLEELGMFPDTAKALTAAISKTYGLVLVTGPTGSGKTTTLYSVLSIVNTPEVNIVTVEDPIEYNMPYINQTQINPHAGITFASGLRAILRQDPNIVMVGEIRDEETAEIAVHAALTGHRVLSTLHTNDALTAVPRLLDMKVPAFLASAVLNAVLAQRLVRRICLDCIASYTPSTEVIQAIRAEIERMGPGARVTLPATLYRGGGCAACGGRGYRGRVGIFEIVPLTETMRALIADPAFTLDHMREAARKEGMMTMFEDGLRKVIRGLTTIEEVLRVMRE